MSAPQPRSPLDDFSSLPPLPESCNSWIATSPGGDQFCEVWQPENARRLQRAGWTVRTALDHLSRLNLPATNTGD